MAVYTLEKLIKGDEEIPKYYKNAKELWNEIKNSKYFDDVNSLAKLLTIKQLEFEKNCGGRWLGQEIMAIVGIGQFYSLEVGFDFTIDDAIKVKNAFAQSYCSLEVKWHAEKAVKIFNLNENDLL